MASTLRMGRTASIATKHLLAIAWTVAGAALAQAQTPPPIPHSIDGYLVTRAENSCLECHDSPSDIGKKRAKGLPPPAPAGHYDTPLGPKPRVADSHFFCTSCHKPK
jgi:cytochrome c-type protein NapB